MEERSYNALRTYGGVYFVAGILLLIVGALSGVIYLFSNVGMGLLIIVLTMLLSLPLLAFNNLIELIINLEENTHNTAEYLRQQVYGKNKKNKTSEYPATRYICTKCNSEIEDDDIKCKKCKSLLSADGAVKKVKKK